MKYSFRLRYVPAVSITLLVAAAVLHPQLTMTDWFFTMGGGCRYCRGWPFPYMLLQGTPPVFQEFYSGRFTIDALITLTIAASSVVVFARWTRARFQITLLQALGITTVVALIFSLRSVAPGLATPYYRTPWYVQAGLLLGMGCTIYVLGAVSIKVVLLVGRKLRTMESRSGKGGIGDQDESS